MNNLSWDFDNLNRKILVKSELDGCKIVAEFKFDEWGATSAIKTAEKFIKDIRDGIVKLPEDIDNG